MNTSLGPYWEADVIIAPTRGSNRATGGGCPPSTGVIIAPTRGSNGAGCMPGRAWTGPVIIAPTRGSNLTTGLGPVKLSNASSSPLRGAATSRIPVLANHRVVIIAPTRGSNMNIPEGSTAVRMSSSPLRGAATGLRGPCAPGRPPRHHRPYEGQQHVDDGDAEQAAEQVIIAPARGSNAANRATAASSGGSHHPPYEGQQRVDIPFNPCRPGRRHHRPYEGQQPGGDLVGGGQVRPSSSPLRGAATL